MVEELACLFELVETSDGFEAECYLFEDALTNWVGPTRAIYFNSADQVCAPDGTASGVCRRWFGNCQVTQRLVPRQPVMCPVSCRVWSENGWQSGPSGAVYMPGANRAWVPDGTSQGSCGRWVGRCVAQSDGADVSFSVFNDGNASRTPPPTAYSQRGPTPPALPMERHRAHVGAGSAQWSRRMVDERRASCSTTAALTGSGRPTRSTFARRGNFACRMTSTGACRKWFGDCQVPVR